MNNYRINRTVTMSQLKEQIGRLGRGVPKHFDKQLPRIAADAIVVLRRKTRSVTPYAPVDTRAFLRGWKMKNRRRFVIDIVNDTPYADVLERGRRPNRRPPPSRVLVGWVRRKLKVDKARAPGVAFVVARNIGRRGWRGKFVMFRSLPEIRSIYLRRLQLAQVNAMREATRR